MSGLLNKALTGLRRLFNQEAFSDSDTVNDELDDMTRDELKGYLAELRYRWKEKRDEATPEAEANTGNITSQEDTATAIPDEIKGILTSVADHYGVEAKDIYNNYLDLKEKLDQPYPLSKFKKTLEGAKDSLGFETGGFIRPFKLNYTDKLTYDFVVAAVIADISTVCGPHRMKVYRLTADNSKKDFIKEAHKAEAVLYELGVSEKDVLTKRDEFFDCSQNAGRYDLSKASKEKLLEYLWKLYDSISEGKRR